MKWGAKMKVVLKRLIKEGHKDTAVTLYRELIAESRKEAGCITYELYEDTKQSNLIAMIEEWEDIKALEAHKQTVHVRRLVPLIDKITAEKFEMEMYSRIV